MEIIKELNELKIIQKSGELLEDLPKKYIKTFEESNLLAEGLDVDTRRWYETSTSVYNIYGDRLIGVRIISNLFSENSSHEDVYHQLTFHEMEKVKITTYKIKED